MQQFLKNNLINFDCKENCRYSRERGLQSLACLPLTPSHQRNGPGHISALRQGPGPSGTSPRAAGPGALSTWNSDIELGPKWLRLPNALVFLGQIRKMLAKCWPSVGQRLPSWTVKFVLEKHTTSPRARANISNYWYVKKLTTILANVCQHLGHCYHI